MCLSLPLQLQSATLAFVSAGSSWHRHRSDAGLAVLPRLIRSNTAPKVRGSTKVQNPTVLCAKAVFCYVQHKVLSSKPMPLGTRLREERGLSEARGGTAQKGRMTEASFTDAWAKLNSGAKCGPGASQQNLLFLNLGVPRKNIEIIAGNSHRSFVGWSWAVTKGASLT